jgi:hypothetical protein
LKENDMMARLNSLGAAPIGATLLCALSAGCSGGTTGKTEAPGATTPHSGGQADKAPPVSKAASLIREEFRAKVKPFKVYNSPDPKSRWTGRNIDDLSAFRGFVLGVVVLNDLVS